MLNTQIEYSDIENPLKTIFKPAIQRAINIKAPVDIIIEMRHFIFKDNTDRFSIDTKETETNFLNMHSFREGINVEKPKGTLLSFSL